MYVTSVADATISENTMSPSQLSTDPSTIGLSFLKWYCEYIEHLSPSAFLAGIMVQRYVGQDEKCPWIQIEEHISFSAS